MKIYAQITNDNKIVPCNDFDYDNFRKIPKNKILTFEIKKERNLLFHRKFFVLVNLLFDNQESYKNIEDFRHDLLISSGFYEERNNFLTGEIILKAKSISFAKMDNLEFQEVYKKVIDTALKLIPMDKKELLEEIERYF